MGVRGELFSTRISCDGRTYFFNVKENRTGDLFLTVVESKPTETGDFDRRSIVIFQDNADEFVKAFQKSLEVMKEAAPSDRTKPPRTRKEGMAPRDDGRETSHRLSDDERPRHYIDTGKPRGPRPARDDDRPSSVRRDIDRATGRTSTGPNDDRRSSADRKPAGGKGRVLRVKPKTSIPPAKAEPKAKPRRMTVKKASPKDDQ
ncbi:MAG: DUF3276 family protein [Spirochaetia bacterium]|jgi:hypothetical protein|nr:DUF3276 family protein [Spirochaetia bacterium]